MAENVTKELFTNVYGYEDVKKELNRIRMWLSDEKLINNDKVMLPSAVIFYGRCGCGKTLMLREFANSFNKPIYTITGDSENVCKEITDTFAKARQDDFAVILVDEIDLIIGNNSRIERVFQEELDGINKKGHVLVLATTNNFYSLDEALLRPGRFDRQIEISYPDKKSREQLLKKFVADLGIDNPNIDFEHASKICFRCSCAALKAVVNDAFLRAGKDINADEIERSYDRIVNKNYEDKSSEFKDFRVAIHEAGHSLMTLRFKDNFSFYTASFNKCGGSTEVQETDERTDTIQKREQNIMIAMSGYIAEQVYFGNKDVGSFSDYSKIQDAVSRLVERVCVFGINQLVPSDFYENPKHWAESRVNKNEKLCKKLIKKYEKETYKYIKRHYKQLVDIANLMYKEGKFTYKQASALVGCSI